MRFPRRFPALTDESRYCRGGKHATVLTPLGQLLWNLLLAVAVSGLMRWAWVHWLSRWF